MPKPVRAGGTLLVALVVTFGAVGCGRHKGGLHGDFCSKLRVYADDYRLRVDTTDLGGMQLASRVYTDLAAAAPPAIAPVVDLLDAAYRDFAAAGVTMTERDRASRRYPPARIDAAYGRLVSYGRTECRARFRT